MKRLWIAFAISGVLGTWGLRGQTNTFPSSGNAGIGTPSPDQKLTVQGGVAIRDSAGADGGQTLYVANTTASGVNYGAVILAVGSGSADNTGGYFSASGATNNYGVRIVGPSAGANNWAIYADAGAPSYFAGNVGIGTTNPEYPLSVNGTVQAKEVLVNTGWSDYVFAPGYRLAPLSEVADFIKDNHHLPGIPSEAEVQQSGVSLGDMQSKLLAKIEELTLHMIAGDERATRLEKENAALHAQIREIQNRAVRLEEKQ
jgi:hypothetical protein